MTDDVWQRDEIASPCQKICVIHPEAGLCIGCLRSVKEIAGWSRMDPAVRRELMAELPARKDLLKGKRRGGRARRLDR